LERNERRIKQEKDKLNHLHTNVVILLPTFNGERFIKEQIQSIQQQSFRDFYLHIFDDCSTDQTREIVTTLADNDDRIQIHCNGVRKGVIKNVNDALLKIDAEIYFLADQDDVWLVEKMARQMEAFQQDNVIMTFTNLLLVDENGNSSGMDFWSCQEINPQEAARSEILAIKTMVTGCTMAFKKRLLKITLPIPEQATMHDHWLSFFAAKIGRVMPIPEELVLYRQHSENVIGASVTPRLQREKRYAGCLSYQDFKTRKLESFQHLLVSLEAFVERLEQNSLKDPTLKKYIAFYTSIIDRQWLKALRFAFQLKRQLNSVSFLRTLFVAAFFPWFYLLLKIHSIVVKTIPNNGSH
jgi:glycosyltransferase involved in cell wall biosynthesis